MNILISKEQGLLNIFRDVFPYLELYDLAVISTLNKSFINSLSQHPVVLIYMLRKYYLNDPNPHPNKRKYFKSLVCKVDIEALNCAELERTIILNAMNRIVISSNLIRPPQIKNMKPHRPPTEFTSIGWNITKNGGDGWLVEKGGMKYRNYELSTSYRECEMIYSVSFNDFGKEFMTAFLDNKAVIKAGCFMSRRWDCEGRGGCDLLVSTKNGAIVLQTRRLKSSQELIPFKYVPVVLEVKYDDIKEYLISELYLHLKIYGKDDRFWAGHYGSKFYGMYIRGDYVNSE